MTHPTINLTEEPSLICPNAAYNCVKYGFQSTVFPVSVGTFAQFVIDCTGLSVASIASSQIVTISDSKYTTSATLNNYERINTSATLTPLILATRIYNALQANDDIFTKYSVVLVGTVITATAREDGVINNFVFDYTAFVGTGITNSETNGTDAVYPDNYRLIVQIWESTLGIPQTLVSKESYIPNKEGLFSINIGKKLSPLLKSRFVFTLPFTTSFNVDDTISKTFCLRVGESYSSTLDECSTIPRDFATTDQILVVNSAFQRNDFAGKLSNICAGKFMTNAPDFTEICENSLAFLWMWFGNVVTDPIPPNTQYLPFWEIFYTDGTSSIHVGADISGIVGTSPFINLFGCVQAGWSFISSYSNPAKIADYYRVRFCVRDVSLPIPTGDTYFGSKYFKIVACCENQLEFYFLNEWGGFDTITMAQLSSIELEQDNSIFESFLDCEDAVISTEGAGAKGKGIINQTSNDVYEVTSKFVDTYQSRLWLREFLTSPEKYVRKTIGDESQIFSKIIVVDYSAQYYSKDDNTIVLKFKYILNENINLQQN